MQGFDNKTRGQTQTTAAPISSLVTFFKPRQVLLNSNSNMKHDKLNATKTPFSLTDQQRVLLFQSIGQFLERSGFSKSLKKFSKEAHVEKESWKSCLLNLEEMCYEFFKLRSETKNSGSAVKEQASKQKDGGIDFVESAETVKKIKKNEGDKEKSEENVEDIKLKKKTSKSAGELSGQIAEETHSKLSKKTEDVSLSVPSEPQKKSKDKKKKHNEETVEEKKEEAADLPAEETLEKADVAQDEKKEKSKNKKKKEDCLKTKDSSVEDMEVDKEKKGSKKRKKSSSENFENGDVGNELLDDSKRRKVEKSDQSNETTAPKTPNGSSNVVWREDEKESQKKNKSKQSNGSAEPRTAANAFRRVKEEEVEFVDEKLQDNSYWAKDGADTGYGAKAQEVLGQVKGRGFRHEKTKKKRGSYRGGQIDLQSHSFKFNYDDDE